MLERNKRSNYRDLFILLSVKCGGNLTIRAGSTGEIKSPRFPLNYPNDVECEWKIHVEEGSVIKLTFTDFEVLAVICFIQSDVEAGGTKSVKENLFSQIRVNHLSKKNCTRG